MQEARCIQDIIKNYLNTIVYIDDKFSLSLLGSSNTEEENQVKKPRRRGRVTSRGLDDAQVESASTLEEEDTSQENDNLVFLLQNMQREFPNIKLQIVKYTDENDQTYIQNCIRSSKFVVIDWKLDEKNQSYTAADALQVIEQEKTQMKLLAVYTSDLEDACIDFEDKFQLKFIEKKQKEKKYKYTIFNNSVVMICNKNEFTAQDLINTYADLLIEIYGCFPSIFFDMLNKMDERVGMLLQKFAKPFDSMLLLQIKSSGLSYEDSLEFLRNIVVNTVKDELMPEQVILEQIYCNKMDTIKGIILNKPETLNEKIEKMNKDICKAVSKANKNKYEIYKKHAPNIIKEEFQKILSQQDSVREKVNGFSSTVLTISTRIADEIAKEMNQKDLDKIIDELMNKGLKEKYSDIQKEDLNTESLVTFIKKKNRSLNEEIKGFCEQITPLILLALIEPLEKKLLNELICNMKLKVYSKDEEVNDLIENAEECFSKNGVQNVFASGDIFYKKGVNGAYEFFMNIVPSCQMFRPKKIEKKFLFISGEVVKKVEQNKLRDSEFILYLPEPSDETNILCVKWKFHDIRQLDLKSCEKNNFSEYKRPYRLIDDYFRQLMSKFNAYYAKVGVDDLFIDTSFIVGNLFLNGDL